MKYPQSGRTAVGTSPYQVIVEQPAWWHDDAGVTPLPALLVHTPLAPVGNQWRIDRLWRNATVATDGVDVHLAYGAWAGNFFAGEYAHVDEGAKITYPGGVWTAANYGYSSNLYGYAGQASTNATRPLVYAIPEGTTKLFALMYQNTDTTKCTLSLSGDGTVLFPTLKLGTANEGGSDIPSGNPTSFDAWLEIARDCGGQNLTMTPVAGAGSTVCMGFIAVNENSQNNPYEGVLDPSTLTLVQAVSLQSPHPIKMEITGGADNRLWGIGGHFDADNTLASATETLETETDGVKATFTPIKRTRVVAACDQFCVSISGTMMYDIASTSTNVGTYAFNRVWGASGQSLPYEMIFNAAAESANLEIGGDSYNGGYGQGQWGLDPLFVVCRSIADIGRTVVAPFDDGDRIASGGNVKMLEGGGLVALFTGDSRIIHPSSNTWYPSGEVKVVARNSGIPKFYSHTLSNDTPVPVVDGMRLVGCSHRTLALKQAL